MKKALSLTLLATCLGTLGASAQHYYNNELHSGTYLSIRSAYTLPGDAKETTTGIGIGLKNGYDVSAALGYRIMLNEIHSFKFLETRKEWALRFEVEGGYGENDLGIDGSSIGTTAEGSLKTYRAMANVMLDIPLTDMLYVSLGGGIGWIHAKFNGSGSSGGISVSGSASDNAFAYQGGIALGAQLNDYWAVELSYRAMSYTDVDFGGITFEAPLVNMLGIAVSLQF